MSSQTLAAPGLINYSFSKERAACLPLLLGDLDKIVQKRSGTSNGDTCILLSTELTWTVEPLSSLGLAKGLSFSRHLWSFFSFLFVFLFNLLSLNRCCEVFKFLGGNEEGLIYNMTVVVSLHGQSGWI